MNTPVKNKKGFSFNFIDIVLIIMVAVSVALLVYVMFFSDDAVISSKGEKAYKTEVRVVLRVENIDNRFDVDIAKGEKVSDEVNGYVIGTVESVKDLGMSKYPSEETKQTEITVKDSESGEEITVTETVTVYYTYPDRHDIEITVVTDAAIVGGVCEISGNEMRVGNVINVKTPYFVCKAQCISITEISSDVNTENGGES